jgi:hypothetical protein
MSGSGTTQANGGIALTSTSTKIFAGSRRLEIGGASSSWSGGAILMGGGGSPLQNGPGSTLAVTGGSRALSDLGSSATILNDGTLNVSLDAPANELTLSAGMTRNTGTIEVLAGTLAIPKTFIQTAGVTRLAGGSLSTDSLLEIQGGFLEGNGQVTGSVACGGVLSPGLSAGRLSIAGDLTLQPGGDADRLGGLTQGTSYDFSDDRSRDPGGSPRASLVWLRELDRARRPVRVPSGPRARRPPARSRTAKRRADHARPRPARSR